MPGPSRLAAVWLSRSIGAQILAEAEFRAPLETGGILMGYFTIPLNQFRDLVITDLIGPGPDAAHHRLSFEPDHDWQVLRLAEIYARSGRTAKYVGDWHTHPEGQPVPSIRDKNTLELISRHQPARCPEPIMLIAGNPLGSSIWKLRTYSHERSPWRPAATPVSVPLRFSE